MNRTPPHYEQPPDSLLEDENELVLHAKFVDGQLVEEWITPAEAKRRHAAATSQAASTSPAHERARTPQR